jgi:hypothetical protein
VADDDYWAVKPVRDLSAGNVSLVLSSMGLM